MKKLTNLKSSQFDSRAKRIAKHSAKPIENKNNELIHEYQKLKQKQISNLKMKTKNIRKNITTIAVAILLTLFLGTSCSRDTIIGPTGATGPAGLTGPAGNANVQEYDFIVTNWTQSGNSWYADYSGVTIKKTDVVMVYLVTGSGTSQSYTALTFTLNDIQTCFSNTINDVTVTVNSASGTTTVSKPGSSVWFKIVIIPSTLRLAAINHRNFTEVKAAYYLKGR
ncbi:MAG: hypothetical protein ACYDCN_12475 [Bacteroidia bacterium]